MLRRILFDFICLAILWPLVKFVWTVAIKAGENAVLGWIDDRIAEAFGIKAPTVSAVLAVIWEWGPPLALALALIGGFHWLRDHREAHANEPIAPLLPPDTDPEYPGGALPISVQHLEKQTNYQIRGLVADLAARMRTFEANSHASRATLVFQEPYPQNATEEQKSRLFLAKSSKLIEATQDASREFSVRFRPEGEALLNEIWRRLGVIPPPNDHDTVRTLRALQFGSLAGAFPVAEAASYLERLARRLP
jgi:hypothetical protein